MAFRLDGCSLCAPKIGLFENCDEIIEGRRPTNRGSQPFSIYLYFNHKNNLSNSQCVMS